VVSRKSDSCKKILTYDVPRSIESSYARCSFRGTWILYNSDGLRL